MLFIIGVLLALWFLVALAGSVIDLLIWVVVGLAGALIGGALYTLATGQSTGGPLSLINLVMSVVGAVILLAVIKAVRGRQVA